MENYKLTCLWGWRTTNLLVSGDGEPVLGLVSLGVGLDGAGRGDGLVERPANLETQVERRVFIQGGWPRDQLCIHNQQQY